MSTTANLRFHIPHIVDVADYLLFSDLLNFIVFRSVPSAQLYTWRYCDYTRADHGRQRFKKHAQHI
ncbi:hypothetical protein BG003_000436 [Podila horticola]|nr:hypothetical protein BG003_000436 [Podila horticola]